jgi:formate/nitrite transporter FocA (FNT family)/protein-disulfide isomerase
MAASPPQRSNGPPSSSEPASSASEGRGPAPLPGEEKNDATSGSLRDALDRSERGAPAAGEAVRDLFSTDEIFHRLLVAADEEFGRSMRLLFLSGLAAGLSISLSFLGMAALSALWPGGPSHLGGSLLYPLGFLLVGMGRYQLFTENTLTPVTLVLTRIASLPRLLRIWGVVLAANVLGAALFAYVLATTGVFTADMAEVATGIGRHFLDMSWSALFWKGVFAGWLVASMVWLHHAARSTTARALITFALIYPVAAAELAHCIVGSTEVLYVVFQGGASASAYLFGFLAPSVLGNTMGGVLLVAILNFAQTRGRRFLHRGCGQVELTWTEWLLGPPENTAPSAVSSAVSSAASSGASSAASSEASSAASSGASSGASFTAAESPDRLEPPVGPRDHVDGPDDAPVTVVHYGDYTCPASRQIDRAVRQVQHVLRSVEDSSGRPFRYVFRHLPLRQRPKTSLQAAVAGEAAARQDAFWVMHEQLFAHQKHLDENDLHAYAAAVGLDLDRFDEDIHDPDLRHRVGEHRASALKSGVREASNLFIDGERHRGDIHPEALLRAIRRRAAVSRAAQCGGSRCCPLPLDHPASACQPAQWAPPGGA